MRNVQISQELFMQLLRFHLIEDESCEKEIKKELEKKLDKMVMRDLFGKSKTAPTKPSAFESEIHPSHKLRLCSAYFALAGGKPPIGG